MTESRPESLRVSPEIARIVSHDADRELKLAAVSGRLELSLRDQVTVLFFLCHGSDPEIRTLGVQRLRRLPAAELAVLAADASQPPRLLHFLAQLRGGDAAVLSALLQNDATAESTYAFLAERVGHDNLAHFLAVESRWRPLPTVTAALLRNPHLDASERDRLDVDGLLRSPDLTDLADLLDALMAENGADSRAGGVPVLHDSENADQTAALLAALDALAGQTGESDAPEPGGEADPDAPDQPLTESDPMADDEDGVDAEEDAVAEADETGDEEISASKFQLALEMGVSEKIKMALTGDKEWRTIFLKDPNKLVHSAVLKNPRITEGEVLAVAKNKAASEELIRGILLNQDWVKLPLIRAALVTHPKTPPAQALRFMNVLSEKELKVMAKSKGISQILVNAARRMVVEKAKKK